MFQLSPQQIDFMDTFGYLHVPGLIADRIAEVDEAFETLMRRNGGDAHDGSKRFCMVPFINHCAYLCTLLDDPRIHGIASALLGEDYQYWNSDGNYYAGDTGWHSDTQWPEPIRFYKMAIYLDRMTRDSGALRVIPGSHRFGEGYAEVLQEQLYVRKNFWGAADGRDVPAVALETEPGDLVISNHSTKHSAWGGNQRRRMFTLVYTGLHEGGDDLEAYRAFLEQVGYTKREVFGPGGPLLETAPPQRLRHLRQLVEHIPEAA